MNKELNIGDYVRTKYGITQYKEYETTNGSKLLCMPVKDGSNGTFANIEDIIESSPSIIDLIQVGDYVNGMYVEDVNETFVNVATGSNYFQNPTIYEKDIKSIVTKEQFESLKYKIGE